MEGSRAPARAFAVMFGAKRRNRAQGAMSVDGGGLSQGDESSVIGKRELRPRGRRHRSPALF